MTTPSLGDLAVAFVFLAGLFGGWAVRALYEAGRPAPPSGWLVGEAREFVWTLTPPAGFAPTDVSSRWPDTGRPRSFLFERTGADLLHEAEDSWTRPRSRSLPPARPRGFPTGAAR